MESVEEEVKMPTTQDLKTQAERVKAEADRVIAESRLCNTAAERFLAEIENIQQKNQKIILELRFQDQLLAIPGNTKPTVEPTVESIEELVRNSHDPIDKAILELINTTTAMRAGKTPVSAVMNSLADSAHSQSQELDRIIENLEKTRDQIRKGNEKLRKVSKRGFWSRIFCRA